MQTASKCCLERSRLDLPSQEFQAVSFDSCSLDPTSLTIRKHGMFEQHSEWARQTWGLEAATNLQSVKTGLSQTCKIDDFPIRLHRNGDEVLDSWTLGHDFRSERK